MIESGVIVVDPNSIGLHRNGKGKQVGVRCCVASRKTKPGSEMLGWFDRVWCKSNTGKRFSEKKRFRNQLTAKLSISASVDKKVGGFRGGVYFFELYNPSWALGEFFLSTS